MGKILPVLLLLIGVGAGGGAGFMLRPAPPEMDEKASQEEEHSEDVEDASEDVVDTINEDFNYVKINNQFVIPVIKNDRIAALVVMSVSLETKATETSGIYDREPKLRDAFLQVMFDHAYIGGFDGVYTAPAAMDALRRSLLMSARRIVNVDITDVLITDIVKQEV